MTTETVIATPIYRTYFHMQTDWGLDETNVLRNVRRVENILIKSGMFNVGGKKQVTLLEAEEEILAIDVAEHEIERPKKSGGNRAEVSSACVAPSTREDITVVSKDSTH